MAGYVPVKRLYLVGASKDGKKLVFAQKKGAKFGSLEVPISTKLLRLIDEVQEAREAKRKPAHRKAEEASETDRVPSAAERELASSPAASSAETGASEADQGPPAPIGIVAADQIDIPVTPDSPGSEDQAEPEPLPGINPARQGHPSVGLREPEEEVSEAQVAKIERIRPRTEKPEIPAKSKLTPAEIQTLIRAGRGIRSVANLAGTPVDWVRYLAEPIQEERRGIVRQMLTRRQERARLGLSGSTIGDAIVENLRARGVRAPEVIIEEGFTAFRPDGREWRVRLVFEHRGRRQTASWSFDAQTRQVTALNSLATSLGWRRPGRDGEEGARPRRARSTSGSRGRRTLKSTGRKRTTSGRKRSARKTSARRRSRR
ncbi:MAG: septation protein SepH [Actinomycetota bacterium]